MLMQQNSSSSRCGVNTVPLDGVAISAARPNLPPLRACGVPTLLRRTFTRIAERQAAKVASCKPVSGTMRGAGSQRGRHQLCAAVQ